MGNRCKPPRVEPPSRANSGVSLLYDIGDLGQIGCRSTDGRHLRDCGLHTDLRATRLFETLARDGGRRTIVGNACRWRWTALQRIGDDRKGDFDHVGRPTTATVGNRREKTRSISRHVPMRCSCVALLPLDTPPCGDKQLLVVSAAFLA